MHNIDDLLKQIKSWGESEENILAIGLVGSFARNVARKDSDIDLMILCKDPKFYLSDEGWINNFGNPKEIRNEIWGQLKTKRVFFKNGLEVEFNFDKKSWANPEDPGTKRVVNDGMKILVDKENILQDLKSE